MAADAKTQGLAVLQTLYPDPTVRDARAAELGDAGITALGNATMMRADYSREMNELGTQRTALTTTEAAAKTAYEANVEWFAQKKADLEELDRLRQQVATGVVKPAETPKPADPKLVTAEQLAETERGAVSFITELGMLSMQHFQQFGEVLDANKLLGDKRVQQIGIRGVYAEVYKPQLDAREAKKKADAEAAIRLDERTRINAERSTQHFPQLVRSAEGSPLDRFEPRPADQPAPVTRTVDEMAAEYTRLQSLRTTA